MYCIYCYTNKITGKKYVGQTCKSLKERARQGGIAYIRKGGAFGNAIKKYGWENFEVEILEYGLTAEQANEREQYWISELNTLTPNGYNIKKGGDNHEWSESSKQKLSQAKMGHEVSDETKEKLRQAFIGKSLSDEHRKHISEGQINGSLSKSVKQYSLDGEFIKEWPSMSEVNRQLGLSAGWIAKCCMNPGKHQGGGFLWTYSEDSLEKGEYEPRTPVHQGRKVCQYSKEGQFIAEYPTINEASKKIGVSRCGIKNCCDKKPRYNTAGGYIWKYKEAV